MAIIEDAQRDGMSNESQSFDAPEDTEPTPPEHGDISKLYNTVKAVREERDTFKRELSQLKQQFQALEGIDPDQYKRMQKELEFARQQQEQMDAIRQELQAEKETEIQKVASQVNEYKQQLEQLKTDYLIEAAFAAADGRMDEDGGVSFKDLYMHHNRDRFARDKQGRLVVLDDNKRPMLDQNGNRIDPKEYIEMHHKRHKVFAAFFRSNRKGGYGDFGNGADSDGGFPDRDPGSYSNEELWGADVWS